MDLESWSSAQSVNNNRAYAREGGGELKDDYGEDLAVTSRVCSLV